MRKRTVVLGLTAVGCLSSCGQDVADPTGLTATVNGATSAADTTRTATSVRIVGLPSFAMVGQRFIVQAQLSDNQGVWWVTDGSETWESSDPSVVTATRSTDGPIYGPDGAIPLVRILGEGDATLSVRVGDLTASGQITSLPADPPVSDGLAVELSVVEFPVQPVSQTVEWYYAPLIVVTDRSGAGALVYGIEVDIPGVARSPFCSSLRPVDANQSVELLQEIYGDYELTFDRPGGHRATEAEASAVVYFVDSDGHAGKVPVSGPIVPGPSFRDTYTGRIIPHPWRCDIWWLTE